MTSTDPRTTRGIRATRLAGALMSLLTLGWLGVAGAQELQVIELRHRLAEQVIPALQPLLEPGGVITGMDGMLFVRTSPANLEQIRQAVAALDRQPRQLRITVGQGTVETAADTAVRGAATIGSGDVPRWASTAPPPTPGVAVTARRTTQRADLRNVSSVTDARGQRDLHRDRPVGPAHHHAGDAGLDRAERRADHRVPRHEHRLLATPRVNGDVVTLDLAPTQQRFSGPPPIAASRPPASRRGSAAASASGSAWAGRAPPAAPTQRAAHLGHAQRRGLVFGLGQGRGRALSAPDPTGGAASDAHRSPARVAVVGSGPLADEVVRNLGLVGVPAALHPAEDFWGTLRLADLQDCYCAVAAGIEPAARRQLNALCQVAAVDFVCVSRAPCGVTVETFPFGSDPGCACLECEAPAEGAGFARSVPDPIATECRRGAGGCGSAALRRPGRAAALHAGGRRGDHAGAPAATRGLPRRVPRPGARRGSFARAIAGPHATSSNPRRRRSRRNPCASAMPS
jgi:hypothetical protein